MKLLFLLFRGYQFMINNLNPNFGTSQIAPFDGDPIKKKTPKKPWIKSVAKHAFFGEG